MKMTKTGASVVVGLILWLAFGVAGPALGAEDIHPAVPEASPQPSQAPVDTSAPMTDIHDIRPPVPMGVDAAWLMPVLLTLAGVFILAALIWWWRHHRKKRTIETIVPELPPEMVAMQALDAISDVRGQEGKAFYFRLSAILRQYIFGRFGVGAPEMTTEEFLPCINRLPLDRELSRQLKDLCRAMEPVKFAGGTTVEKQMEADFFFVRAFVRQTTPALEVDEQVDNEKKSKKQIPILK